MPVTLEKGRTREKEKQKKEVRALCAPFLAWDPLVHYSLMTVPGDAVDFRIRNDHDFNAVRTEVLRVENTEITGTASVPDTLSSAAAGQGAITIEATNTTGGIDVDAGTAGIDVDTGGPVTVTTTDATATAVQVSAASGGIDINAGTGGVDVDTAGQVSLDSSQATSNAIEIVSSDPAGGIDVDAGTGGIDVDTTGLMSVSGQNVFLTAAPTGSISVAAGIAGITVATTGQITLDASDAGANAIELVANDGGIDVSAAGSIAIDSIGTLSNTSANQITVASAQAATDAIHIKASNASGGGITLDTGSGGISFPKATVTQLTSLTTGVTVNSTAGVITTVTATLAPNATASFVVTNNRVAATSVVVAGVQTYSGTFGTNGIPTVAVSAVVAGSFTATLANSHGTAALDGTVDISFLVL